MSANETVRCVADVKAVLGEGPLWVPAESALYWVDIKGRKIFRLSGDESIESWPTSQRVGSLAPRASGDFIAGTDAGFAIVHPAQQTCDVFADPEAELPNNRFNDGKVDRHGRFWAGTMDDTEEQASGSLYRVDTDHQWTLVDTGYKVTNGPTFSPDGSLMYVNDSGLQRTYVFDLDADGNASNKRVFKQYGERDGYPDGMTVDAEGCLWVAFWDGWCIRRFSPEGELLRQIDLPVQKPTSVAFAGPALDRLYVTSASIGLSEDELSMQPYAGGLFLVDAGVSGVAEVPFAG